MNSLAPTIQAFFTERLMAQRHASPNTIAAYRDTFCLLLAFVEKRSGKSPANLEFVDLDSGTISAFLDHLERERGNSIRTRNVRLAAIHSLFRFAMLRHPEHAGVIERVLAIPPKRFQRRVISYLRDEEVDALLKAPDRATFLGRRDYALILTAIQTGLRVTELARLTIGDVVLGTGAHIRCVGKGRKERVTPLMTSTAKVLGSLIAERGRAGADPLFATRQGEPLGRYGISVIIDRHVKTATRVCPSFETKTVSPHVLRHTAAMRLLHAGVDTTVIALWLGHESVETTQIYLHADLALKEKALARITPISSVPGRYRPSDKLLAFLKAL